MTPKRAREIMAATGPFCSIPFAFRDERRSIRLVTAGGITLDEHDAIMRRWLAMPGTASYWSALCSLANDDFSKAEGL